MRFLMFIQYISLFRLFLDYFVKKQFHFTYYCTYMYIVFIFNSLTVKQNFNLNKKGWQCFRLEMKIPMLSVWYI